MIVLQYTYTIITYYNIYIIIIMRRSRIRYNSHIVTTLQYNAVARILHDTRAKYACKLYTFYLSSSKAYNILYRLQVTIVLVNAHRRQRSSSRARPTCTAVYTILLCRVISLFLLYISSRPPREPIYYNGKYIINHTRFLFIPMHIIYRQVHLTKKINELIKQNTVKYKL